MLADGASAVYGADAVGGVVNLVTKRRFEGIDTRFEYGNGFAAGSDTRRLTATAGFGRGALAGFVVADYSTQGMLLSKELGITSGYFQQGGTNIFFPGGNPGYVSSVDGANLPGLNAPSAAIPANQDGHNLTQQDFIATQGQLPSYDAYRIGDRVVVPESRSRTIFSAFDWDLPASIRAHTELSFNAREYTESRYPGSDSYINFNVATGGFPVVPATNPYNPFGVPVQVESLAVELNSVYGGESESYRVLQGFSGDLPAGLRWDTGVAYSRSAESYVLRDRPATLLVEQALNQTDPARALNVFGSGPVNSQAVLDSIRIDERSEGTGELLIADAKVTGEMFALPAGRIAFSVGGEYRKESIYGSFTRATFNLPSQEITASSHVSSAFGEALVPLLGRGTGPERAYPRVDLSAAVRLDSYGTFGDTWNPKATLRVEPVRWLLLRGSVGTGFRAPTLAELFSAEGVGTTGPFFDPKRGAQGDIQTRATSGGNPGLQPESSTSQTLGFVLTPAFAADFSLGVDYYRIELTDKIGFATVQYFVEQEDVLGRVTRAAPTAEDIARGVPGTILSVDTRNLNVSRAEISGFDVFAALAAPLGVGRLRFDARGTFIEHFKSQDRPDQPELEEVGTFGFAGAQAPALRFKGNATVSYDLRGLTVAATVRHVGDYDDLPETGLPDLRTSASTQGDLQVNYSFEDSPPVHALSGTTVTVGARNITDERPPYSRGSYGYDGRVVDPQRATYYVRLNKRW